MGEHVVIRRRLGVILAGGPFLLLLLAGALKAVDAGDFQEALTTWEFVPSAAQVPVAILIPAFEMALGGAWLLGIHRKLATVAGASFLLSLTSLYAAHLAWSEPPSCGCFALVDRYWSGRGEAWFVLIRNGALLGFIGAGVLLQRSGGCGSPEGSP